MATAVEVRWNEISDFLSKQGFQEVRVPGTHERVMSKFVDKNLCLRVYTSVEGESSRGVGEDAIRTVLVVRINGDVKVIGADRRVHRVSGWRKNLQDRLDRWREQLGPACPKCRAATVRKRSRRGPFWGCCKYPVCKTVQPIQEPARQPRAGERGGEHEGAAMARRERAETPPKFQDEHDEHMALERSISDAMAASENAWQERMEEKAAYAKLEAEQERRAYLDEMRAELEANGIYDGDDEPAPAPKPRPVMAGGDPPPANW